MSQSGDNGGRPTIFDIAKAVGVSHTTVSRALRGDSRISEETTRKILAKAKEINYRPNIMARALARQGNSLIGLILRHISGSFFSEIISGLQEEIESKGFSLLLCNSEMSHGDEKKHLHIMLDKQVEGIIISPVSTEGVNRKAFLQVLQEKVPLVMVGNPKEQVDAPYVKVDNILGGYLVGKHLMELGHKEIVYISPSQEELLANKSTLHSENIERFLGIHQAALEFNQAQSLHVVEGPNEEITPQVVEEILAIQPRPSAIFAYSDLMAIKVMRLLEKKGLAVPRDFSVVGYDDLDIASLVNPALTTIAQPKKELGRIAALKLLGLIEGLSTTETVIRPELIVRDTTAAHVEAYSKLGGSAATAVS